MPDVSSSAPALVDQWIVFDVHKNSLVAGILPAQGGTPQVSRIENTERAIRRFFKKAGDPATLAVAYEAGPCGYDLYRLLCAMGIACDVIGHCPAVSTRASQSDQLSLPSRRPPDPSGATTAVIISPRRQPALDTGVHLRTRGRPRRHRRGSRPGRRSGRRRGRRPWPRTSPCRLRRQPTRCWCADRRRTSPRRGWQ